MMILLELWGLAVAVSELWAVWHLPIVCAFPAVIVGGVPPKDHITQHLCFWSENLILAKLEWVLIKGQALSQELSIEITNWVLMTILWDRVVKAMSRIIQLGSGKSHLCTWELEPQCPHALHGCFVIMVGICVVFGGLRGSTAGWILQFGFVYLEVETNWMRTGF